LNVFDHTYSYITVENPDPINVINVINAGDLLVNVSKVEDVNRRRPLSNNQV
jgi:hypothetical protein